VLIAMLGWATTAGFAVLHLRTRRRLVLVARASHELRGPLCAAQLGLHGLSAEPTRVAAIELELRRAGRALDDLAAAPSGARGATRLELVDLAALATAYAPAWRALAAAHGAELRLEPSVVVSRYGDRLARGGCVGSLRRPPSPATTVMSPTAVFADPLRIAQACANLVGNAAEHGGGVVRVRVRAAGGQVRIEVSDDGPGLPATVSALTAAARVRHGRRGHGLAIAAAIAEHHGGRLAAAPSEAGARVMLEVPAARAPVVA
jgi:signal transduction histidine kinase